MWGNSQVVFKFLKYPFNWYSHLGGISVLSFVLFCIFFYHWFGSCGTSLKCYLICFLYFCLTCSILCCVLCVTAFEFKSLLSTFLILNTRNIIVWYVRDVCLSSMGPFPSRSVPTSEESDLSSIFSARYQPWPLFPDQCKVVGRVFRECSLLWDFFLKSLKDFQNGFPALMYVICSKTE